MLKLYIYEPTAHAPRNVYRRYKADPVRDRLKHALLKERAGVLKKIAKLGITSMRTVPLDEPVFADVSFGKYVTSKQGNQRKDKTKIAITRADYHRNYNGSTRTSNPRAGFMATHAIQIDVMP